MKDLEMNNSLAHDMIEATRLTQAGRLFGTRHLVK